MNFHRYLRLAATTLALGLLVPGLEGCATSGTADVTHLLTAWQHSDANYHVKLRINDSDLTIGQSTLKMEITTDRAGYLVVAQASADKHDLSILFPSGANGPVAIAAGSHILPNGVEWLSMGPAGVGAVIAIVSEKPMDLNKIRMRELPDDGSYGSAVALIREHPAGK